ncbi:bifunctional helix-turn-helix transcriptional regulator/GNAT family N-acetyltransferase [Rhodoligotrophos defluvii]|uniref:bifunctional helix-turn-helix transcriptional regulator/GNAT family N-acetyltransferase n=1 Tax=Rhodoligotrophos defluvii TaxID=2561934 RepID=UPI0010C9C76C|nr:helix-turn-helix domain-containing GNAT family N-acetyltransferase [Rhodoligotrophos defluvii]
MNTNGWPTGNNQVDAIRAFNRFYTRQLGLLEERLLASEFSLTEARVLYELAHREGLTAADLVRDLGIDPGYLSRIVRKFRTEGIVSTRPAPSDGRQLILSLTETGRRAFAPLDRASQDEVLAMIEPLHPGDREQLVKAMKTIIRILAGAQEEKVPYVLRPPVPGDLGWITHRQGVLYAQEYGWDETFEALVAEIASEFFKKFDPKRERCWIAERGGEIVGSVFLADGGGETAKLRLLYVEPAARGLGIGNRLVAECIGFARSRGYREITLWTNSILTSARKIYEAHGFRLAKEEPHHSFGKDLIGQTWVLKL